jgi:hypothetical protein
MEHRRFKPDAESILPPPKQFISEEDFEELWNTRGWKFRWDEFHQLLLQRGLQPYVNQERFHQMVRDILKTFLVDGEARRDPRRVPRQVFPKVY